MNLSQSLNRPKRDIKRSKTPYNDESPHQINPKRIAALALIIVFAGSFVLWDYHQLNRDFDALKSLLMKTRNKALQKEKKPLHKPHAIYHIDPPQRERA